MRLFSNNVSPVAQWLGLSGLIPFVALAALSFFVSSDHRGFVIMTLLAYGVTIVSFLGAIHWGLTMVENFPKKYQLVWGVVPSLLGWISLSLQTELGLLIVGAVLLLCLAIDYKIYPQYGLERWLRMRSILTFVATASCILPALSGLIVA